MTTIEWTDETWNPVRGCTRVSEGCRHCYAELVAARFSGPGQPYEGLARRKGDLIKLGGHYALDRIAGHAQWTGAVRFVPEHLADPLKWRKPRKVFVNSMSDLFHDGFSNEEIAAVFGVMAAAHWHTFQVLTKRAKQRLREWFAWLEAQAGCVSAKLALVLDATAKVVADAGLTFPRRAPEQHHAATWPLSNVHLGVSVENQDAADERIPELLAAPAAVRFLSCEPLIGPIDLEHVKHSLGGESYDIASCLEGDDGFGLNAPRARIDWVIAGCESGHGARPCPTDWLRALRDQCAAAGVPFFLKQARADELGYAPSVVDGRFVPLPVTTGRMSKRKRGGVIGAPLLDGVLHAAHPSPPCQSGEPPGLPLAGSVVRPRTAGRSRGRTSP